MTLALHRWRALVGVVVLVVGGIAGVRVVQRQRPMPTLTTVEVTRGDFVDIVELRGLVHPLKSVVVSAPIQSGDLQILKIAKNGAPIKAGEIAVEFDGATLLRTIQEKQSDLKQALAEMDQAKAKASIDQGENTTGLVKSEYDVKRAKLDLVDADFISKVDTEKAKLAVSDAEVRQQEAAVKDTAGRTATTTGFTAQDGKIAKIHADIDRAQQGLDRLQIKAPTDGIVNILQNWRNSNGMGAAPEFRPGDSAWPGADILELPDLSSVYFAARLEESDRGRLQAGQSATIRVDAIPDHEYQASVSDVSVLARVDFSSWPPVKNFDLKLGLRDADARLRPGMSAAARINVGRIPNMLLVPAESVFIVDGRPLVYCLRGREFVATGVEIVRRGKDQFAVKGPLTAGDRVSLTKPPDSRAGAGK
jgi:multidrug efflux pump subunit AcrA (membrane-fusion protein)